jgi:hypothetical protein
MTTDAHASPDEPFAPEVDDDEWLRASLTAPARRWPRLTMALAACAVAAVAFMSGVLIEKNYFAGSGSGSGAAGGAGRFAGLFGRAATGTGATGSTGASGALASGVTVGQVKVINGKTFYVTDTSGNTVKVALTGSSRLTAEKQVKVTELRPGDTVTVRGAAGTNGTIKATTVAIGTAGGGFGGFGRGGGAFSGAGGGSAAGSG